MWNIIKRFICEGEIRKPDSKDKAFERAANALHNAIAEAKEGEPFDIDTLMAIIAYGVVFGRKTEAYCIV